MFVALHMSSPAVTISENTPLPEIREILSSRNFRHLPVVDRDHRLVGMITDRDLRSAYPSTVLAKAEINAEMDRLGETLAGSIMSTRLVTLAPGATLDDALYLLDREKVGAIPVVDQELCVLGIFSIRDLIRAYRRLYGLGEKGSALVAIEDDGRPRLLSRIVEVLERNRIPFTRLVRSAGSPDGMEPVMIYLRVCTINVRAVHAALQESGLSIIVPRLIIEKAACLEKS